MAVASEPLSKILADAEQKSTLPIITVSEESKVPYADARKRAECNKAYNKAHAESLRTYRKRYYKRNRKRLLKQTKLWKENYPNYDREWQKLHRKNKRNNQRTYRQRHPERIRALNAAYATRKTGAGGKFTETEWYELKKKYEFRCLRCHKRKKLFPDHVKPVSKGGSSNIGNIQPLCGSCNSVKNNKSTDYR
jgi:HNH endonuclease